MYIYEIKAVQYTTNHIQDLCVVCYFFLQKRLSCQLLQMIKIYIKLFIIALNCYAKHQQTICEQNALHGQQSINKLNN
jgi:hypothetical protein